MNIMSAQKLALLNKILLVNNELGWNSPDLSKVYMLDMTMQRIRSSAISLPFMTLFESYGIKNLFKLLQVLKHAR